MRFAFPMPSRRSVRFTPGLLPAVRIDTPIIAHGIRAMADALCLANGKEQDWQRPDAD